MLKKIIILVVFIAVIVAGVWFWRIYQNSESKYDDFAKCLKNKEAVFYGTFWCPHCKEQKKMFGRAVKFLPYIECSTQDGRTQLQVCKDKNIQGYPTWIFSDGSKKSGKLPLDFLSEKTGCQLPE